MYSILRRNFGLMRQFFDAKRRKGLEGARSAPRRAAPGPERGSAEPRKARSGRVEFGRPDAPISSFLIYYLLSITSYLLPVIYYLFRDLGL
jgi:hypothetical protein